MERIKLFFSLALLLLSACVSSQPESTLQWESQLYADHVLVGSIWDSERDEFIESDELLRRLKGVSYLLLGEKHDNPDHHALQLRVLQHVLRTENVTGVSFEMMDSDQQPLLQDLLSMRSNSLEEINKYLKWDNDGWNWEFYGPLLASALQANVSVAAANISNAQMMKVYGEPTAVEITDVLDASTMTALEKDIDESHCGMLPESQFPSMVRVQQARDHAMAQSLAGDSEQQMRVLFAGNYHIRRDLGVPNYILHERPGLDPTRIVTVAFIEVSAGSTAPQDYLQQFGSVKAYDYIWFTPAISDEDYCAAMQQQ